MCRDHPRICGEKISLRICSISMSGSPPHMRGKGLPRLVPRLSPGITPAYAGKRCNRRSSCCRNQDHPRICGEKRSRFKRRQDVKGSPPHMRGKVKTFCKPKDVDRITPAYAGKSTRRLAARRPGRDHPRICGEKRTGTAALACNWGSPPHMRGKEAFESADYVIVGITPAYAGKSRPDHPPRCP